MKKGQTEELPGAKGLDMPVIRLPYPFIVKVQQHIRELTAQHTACRVEPRHVGSHARLVLLTLSFSLQRWCVMMLQADQWSSLCGHFDALDAEAARLAAS